MSDVAAGTLSEGEREFLFIRTLGAGMEIPQGFLECWPWIKAIHAHDFGDSAPLAAMVISEANIPANVREVLAAIVSGKRVPKAKSIKHLKIKGTDRLAAARFALMYAQIHQRVKNEAQDAAEREAAEPADLIKRYDSAYRNWQKKVYEQYGIGKETLGDLRRELERLIKEWPRL
jgi:hypothetical protein